MRQFLLILPLLLTGCEKAPSSSSINSPFGSGSSAQTQTAKTEPWGKPAGTDKALCKPEMFTSDYIDQHCRDAQGQYLGDLQCYPFAEPQRFNGLVVLSFESTLFYPGAQTLADTHRKEDGIWFSTDPMQNAFSEQDAARCIPNEMCAYQITVTGRASLCRGGYGHDNQYPHELLVEKVERVEQIDVRQP